MYKQILVPIDLSDTELARPAIDTAVRLSNLSGGSVRLDRGGPSRRAELRDAAGFWAPPVLPIHGNSARRR